MTAIRSELRKTFTTKMWWALLIPIAIISMLANAAGGLLEDVIGSATDLPGNLPSLLPLALALTVNQLVVFAAVAGTVAAAGEFRHRTITTTYLVNTSRTAVLVAKLVMGALLGALYGLVAGVSGAAVGLLFGDSTAPGASDLLIVIALGTIVYALWGLIGAGIGLAVGNQVGALLVTLIYLLVGEQIVSAALRNAESESVQELTGYLPGNAGDVAVVTEPVSTLAEFIPPQPGVEDIGSEFAGALAGVTNPPTTVVSLLVLVVWAALVVGLAAFLSARRDIT